MRSSAEHVNQSGRSGGKFEGNNCLVLVAPAFLTAALATHAPSSENSIVNVNDPVVVTADEAEIAAPAPALIKEI